MLLCLQVSHFSCPSPHVWFPGYMWWLHCYAIVTSCMEAVMVSLLLKQLLLTVYVYFAMSHM